MKRIRIALIAPLLSAAVIAAAQNPFRDFLLTGSKAFALLPARPVGGPGVSELAWSSDGRYLLMVCSGIPADGELPGSTLSLASYKRLSNLAETWISLFDIQTGKSQILWSAPKRNWTLSPPKWLAGSSRAFIVAKVSARDADGNPLLRAKVLEITAEDSRVREMYTVPDSRIEPVVEVSPSPSQPLAVLSVLSRDTAVQEKPLTMFLIGDLVRGSRPLGLSDDVTSTKIEWSQDGWRPFAVRTSRSRTAPLPNLMLDFMRGAMESATQKIFEPESEQAGALQSSVDASGVLWLTSSDHKSGLQVAREVGIATLSAGGRGLAFVCNGVALVRPLATMPLRDYYSIRESAERPLFEHHAKRCFHLLEVYARAHEDQFPVAGENLVADLKEFTDDPSDLEGFRYAFSGGKKASISNPKNTLLASLVAVTGTVYIYADGNVRWESAGLGVPAVDSSVDAQR